jgi:phenylalanine-4-hydroxylase
VFHDLFGHVPLLFDPVFADYVQRYGQGGLKAHDLGAGELLSRLYWYTIEFGLIQQSRRAAGLRRRHPEFARRVAPQRHQCTPQRIALDLLRCMRTRYKIDDYQATYFRHRQL